LIYPACVKQYYRAELTAATGAVTAIDRPCVIKSISASPLVDTNTAAIPSMILKVFDGTDSSMIMRFAGSVGAQYRNDNVSILIPASGIRVNTSLGIEVEVIDADGVSTSDLIYSSISMMYQ